MFVDESAIEVESLRELGVWLDARHLRLLVEVALRGSLTAAADALAYTPSGVSRQLSGLQRDIGVLLVARDGRNLRLTRAGWELTVRGLRVLYETRRTQEAVMRLRGQEEELAPDDVALRLEGMLSQLDGLHARRTAA
jgi:DNA-binding transcriptional LysR family regulator